MGIRRRLTPSGVPYPRFIRYAKRFGQPYACLETPAMQKLGGKDPGIITRGPPAIMYWNKPAVEESLAEAQADGMEDYAAQLEGVLENWPKWDDVKNLPRGAYTI